MATLATRIERLETGGTPSPFGELLDSDGRQGNASRQLVEFLDSLGNSKARSQRQPLPVGDSATLDDQAGIDPDFDDLGLSGLSPAFQSWSSQ